MNLALHLDGELFENRPLRVTRATNEANEMQRVLFVFLLANSVSDVPDPSVYSQYFRKLARREQNL